MAGTHRVLVACGLAPCGTLRYGRWGVQLVPSISSPDVFPVSRCVLFSHERVGHGGWVMQGLARL